jgi:hypothetical protein
MGPFLAAIAISVFIILSVAYPVDIPAFLCGAAVLGAAYSAWRVARALRTRRKDRGVTKMGNLSGLTYLERRAALRQLNSEDRRHNGAGLRTFLMGNGLPGYISALSAVTAVVLGVFAYSAWKVQEAAKRKADVAFELLQSATASRRCIDYAMGPFLRQSADLKALEVIARQGREDVRQCGDAFARFSADIFLAQNVLDEDTYHSAFQLYSYVRSKAANYTIALRLLEEMGSGVKEDDPRIKRVNTLLDEVGLHVAVGDGWAYRDWDKNPYPELFIRTRELEKLLGKYINFGPVQENTARDVVIKQKERLRAVGEPK